MAQLGVDSRADLAICAVSTAEYDIYWMSWLDETMAVTEVLSYALLDALLFMPFVRLINKREPSVIAKYLRLSWLYWLIWVLLMVAWLLVDFQAVDTWQVFVENAGAAFLIQIAITAAMIWYANHSKTYRLQYCLQVPKPAA